MKYLKTIAVMIVLFRMMQTPMAQADLYLNQNDALADEAWQSWCDHEIDERVLPLNFFHTCEYFSPESEIDKLDGGFSAYLLEKAKYGAVKVLDSIRINYALKQLARDESKSDRLVSHIEMQFEPGLNDALFHVRYRY